ncbi:hypothetical protein [Legionella sp. W05-934-2]|jgi:hypothetical protein|uniref:hypothetical protein n=1 Tax=Legionella sp. W05-934-2 TaxID=1198649 RepID=UPI00346288ED
MNKKNRNTTPPTKERPAEYKEKKRFREDYTFFPSNDANQRLDCEEEHDAFRSYN